jgi:mitochondrial enoyl-[acyl-carrier protein] reductase / trans-2-enoyl-CoA reductase
VNNLAGVYTENGPPESVLQLKNNPLPPLEADQVLIRMLLAPINPSDLNMLEGTYGTQAKLPAVAGNEGVGRVEKVGPSVTCLKTGQLVRPANGSGTWQQWVVSPAQDCLVFPDQLRLEQAAMLYVNPATAWRMLHDFIDLKPGQWVLQNSANSGVGRCVIQIARALGLRSINLVRRPELIDELKKLGADAVLLDQPESLNTIKEMTEGCLPSLALNAVGGESFSLLCRAAAPGAKVVTYGAMAKQPLRIGNGLLIFKELSLHGYWISRWYEKSSPAEINQMFASLAALNLEIPIAATYPLEALIQAVTEAQKSHRNGKVLLRLGT